MLDTILNPYALKGLDCFYDAADSAEMLEVRWQNKILKENFYGYGSDRRTF